LWQNSQIIQKSVDCQMFQILFLILVKDAQPDVSPMSAQCLPNVLSMLAKFRPLPIQYPFLCPLSVHPMPNNQSIFTQCWPKGFTQILSLWSEPPRPIFGKLDHYSAAVFYSVKSLVLVVLPLLAALNVVSGQITDFFRYVSEQI
jgi:hypothetical protein